MFRKVLPRVWAFDTEWVPDPHSGRMLYGLPETMSDREVVQEMWKQGGATDDVPQPFLRPALCRVVSVVVVSRRVRDDGVSLKLIRLPQDPCGPDRNDEAGLVGRFLAEVGRVRPQLVGFNSVSADLKVLMQRAVALGVQAPAFCRRPEKPWQGVDYHARDQECHVDLMRILAQGGRQGLSLNDIAVVSGVPGKLDHDGNDVADLWLDGRLEEIVAYNECDSLSTYLLWLRLAHFGGHFTDTQYHDEQMRVVELLATEMRSRPCPHLERFCAEWMRLDRMRGGLLDLSAVRTVEPIAPDQAPAPSERS